jgi:hypothetical protein
MPENLRLDIPVVTPAVELEERMPTDPYDFPALSYERLLEIRDHVSRIVTLVEILAVMGLILVIRSFMR